jgi:hypothetical protein
MPEIDIEEIKRHIRSIDNHLQELKDLIIPEDEDWKNTLKRRVSILQGIVDNGGIINYGKYREIIKENGMDLRGGNWKRTVR